MPFLDGTFEPTIRVVPVARERIPEHAGKFAGLEEIDDGIWNVYVGPLKLGRLLEKTHANRGCIW